MRRLCLIYRVLSNKVPNYADDIDPLEARSFFLRSIRTENFKISSLQSVIIDWNKLHRKICSSISYISYKTRYQKSY